MVLLISIILSILINDTLFLTESSVSAYQLELLGSILIPTILIGVQFISKRYRFLLVVNSFVGMIAFSIITLFVVNIDLLLGQSLFMSYLMTNFVLVSFYKYYPLYPIDKMPIRVYKRGRGSRLIIETIVLLSLLSIWIAHLIRTKY